MSQYLVKSFPELHDVFSHFRKDKRWVFRGHADARWTLIPKCGRPPYNRVSDRDYFHAWQRRAIEHLEHHPTNDWDWLAIAQHHGLATRLLDWTMNPLNAAYFAVREGCDGDAVIYAARFKNSAKKMGDPLKYKNFARFLPHGIVPRISRQGGCFSIHPNPEQPITDKTRGVDALDCITISVNYRSDLLKELSYYGINDATMYPGLDGISKFLNWTLESGEYWRVPAP